MNLLEENIELLKENILLTAIIEKMESWIDDTDWTPCRYCQTFTPCPAIHEGADKHCVNEGGCETTAFDLAKIIVEKEINFS